MAHLLLKLVSADGAENGKIFQFSPQGGTIGRSETCDWTLNDPHRFISKNHALITYQNNQFVVTDTSTNGLFINSANNLLGSGNHHVLTMRDTVIIGEYQIIVTELVNDAGSNQNVERVADGDLLDLINSGGASSSASNHDSLDPLDLLSGSSSKSSSQQDDLGLGDLISSPTPSYQIPNFNPNQYSEPVAPVTKPEDKKPAPIVSNPAAIPEDWELSGIMPAVKDYEPQSMTSADDAKANLVKDDVNQLTQEPSLTQPEPKAVDVMPDLGHDLLIQDGFEENSPLTPVESVPIKDDIPEVQVKSSMPPVDTMQSVAEPIQEHIKPVSRVNVDIQLTSNVEPKKTVAEPVVPSEPKEAVSTPSEPVVPVTSTSNQSDDFLTLLYDKLGLPKEYLASVDKNVFAEDIATVLMSTTQGLMSLLNGRTVFKQESRLSLTSVQPRSNNPLKFSIDPTDTLEMLLLKKKAGYLTAKQSYDEAVNDIQLHQMAFLTGLQATLNGVLQQLEPEKIENEAKEKGRKFMGLNANAQNWQTYKEKQALLATKVQQNLNEVLSSYFADAYQAQINRIKDSNK